MSDIDRFERAIEKLLSDQSPREEALGLEPEELDMLRVAQLVRGTQQAPPRPEFVEELYDRLFSEPRRVSRRTAFFSGLGALAAGVLGGFGIDRAVNSSSSSQATGGRWKFPLVHDGKGTWIAVANQSELPAGAVKAFTARSVQGFLINDGTDIYAMSRICTHMGCLLNFEKQKQKLVCPCHGAEFNLQGQMERYPSPLRDLPPVKWRKRGDVIEVYGA
jgi:nitrite reductase/ring-hydroxylating ferredoxin subunit